MTYLLFEMAPPFCIGVVAFIFILLMFQVLRLTEFVLVHEVSLRMVIHLMSYMTISFLPAILPMSLIFAIVLAYNRLTNDSEVIAIRSLGIGMVPLIAPGLFLGIATSALSLIMAFQIGPWGNRQFEVLINDIGNTKIMSAIKEGTFSESFFDLVVYTNEIDKETGLLNDVFIYNEREDPPTTIIADHGQIFSEKSFNSYKAFIRLTDGDIHKRSDGGHTKIRFKTYDLQMVRPIEKKNRDKSLASLTYGNLKNLLQSQLKPDEYRKYLKEYYKRYALSFACLLFVLLGIGLGCRTHHRSGKSSGGVMSIGIVVTYWILYIVGDSLAKNPALPIWLCAWLPLLVLTPASLVLLKKNWH